MANIRAINPAPVSIPPGRRAPSSSEQTRTHGLGDVYRAAWSARYTVLPRCPGAYVKLPEAPGLLYAETLAPLFCQRRVVLSSGMDAPKRAQVVQFASLEVMTHSSSSTVLPQCVSFI